MPVRNNHSPDFILSVFKILCVRQYVVYSGRMFFFDRKSRSTMMMSSLYSTRTYCAPPLPLRPNGLWDCVSDWRNHGRFFNRSAVMHEPFFPAHAYELDRERPRFLFRPGWAGTPICPVYSARVPCVCPETYMRSPLCSLFVAGIFPSARVGVPPWVPPTLAPCNLCSRRLPGAGVRAGRFFYVVRRVFPSVFLVLFSLSFHNNR